MIVESAIQLEDKSVFRGKRHHNVIHLISTTAPGYRDGEKILKPVIGVQGFVDDKGNFLNRKEAAQHALECGQVETGKAKFQHIFNGETLYSEDVW